MTTKVELYSELRTIAGTKELEFSLPDGATIESLLSELYKLHPRLAEWEERLLIAAGLDHVERAHVILPGEIISVMPPAESE